ncbi:uncharacterized protein GGS22DRAFT_181123 [Annulohypoxylon maeteangense]|uniref:uncharacterized protein n=1 Tax=Annulohypoxylon maeteangense TaxID=1927788 RepID=UPI0020087E92|nr:uncharacterized protein GGS22DRAFT_181123 [Annulohypoxylon maeteangense]KAI0882603.1 hypothetical protein GGS22DRAFT_181123 [Annulohypoxylon maeteangense]
MDSKDLPLDVVGDIDYYSRLSKIRQFVSGNPLAKEEYRFMKILLSSVNVDIISELPIELVLQIADFLPLRDFVTCLAVSKPWRAKFLSISVLNNATYMFCPSVHQASRDTPLDPKECLNALHKIGRMPGRYFQSSLEKPFSWKYESYFKLDPDFHSHYEDMSAAYAQFGRQFDREPDSFTCRDALYSNGRIAWRPWPRIICVDNLWSRTRRVFTTPYGPLVHRRYELRALGDRLVVASMDRRLIVWDFSASTDIRLERKLPGSIRDVSTKGSRIAIILFNGDIILGGFRRTFWKLSTAPLISYRNLTNESMVSWKSNLRVIFHPACNGKFFIASGYTDKSHSETTHRRMIYEFDDDRNMTTFETSSPWTARHRQEHGIPQFKILRGMPCYRDSIGFSEAYQFGELPTSFKPITPFAEFDIYDRKFSVTKNLPHPSGWISQNNQCDMDFIVEFHNHSFTAYSLQSGFDFKIGE